jgi:hypothetical protein
MLQIIPTLLTPAGRAYDLAVASQTSTSLTLSFLYVPGARSYEYSISSTSAVAGFGAWTALPSDKIITGLSPSTQYWIKGPHRQRRGARAGIAGENWNDGRGWRRHCFHPNRRTKRSAWLCVRIIHGQHRHRERGPNCGGRACKRQSVYP